MQQPRMRSQASSSVVHFGTREEEQRTMLLCSARRPGVCSCVCGCGKKLPPIRAALNLIPSLHNLTLTQLTRGTRQHCILVAHTSHNPAIYGHRHSLVVCQGLERFSRRISNLPASIFIILPAFDLLAIFLLQNTIPSILTAIMSDNL